VPSAFDGIIIVGSGGGGSSGVFEAVAKSIPTDTSTEHALGLRKPGNHTSSCEWVGRWVNEWCTAALRRRVPGLYRAIKDQR